MLPKKKVLIVDDSQTVLLMEKMILTKGPYDLVVARDGAEAVVRAEQDRPDVILMDVVMPRMNGIEACGAIRSNGATRHIPIIMVTTRGEEENVEAGYAAGCNDYITKPINGVELLTKLQNVLAAAGAA
jgi:CheY-like chemotaxis protein